MRIDDSKIMFEAYISKKTVIKEQEDKGCQCPCCVRKQTNEDEECQCESGHDETDMANPEEAKEVKIGKDIIKALDSDDLHQVADLARELISMHTKK